MRVAGTNRFGDVERGLACVKGRSRLAVGKLEKGSLV